MKKRNVMTVARQLQRKSEYNFPTWSMHMARAHQIVNPVITIHLPWRTGQEPTVSRLYQADNKGLSSLIRSKFPTAVKATSITPDKESVYRMYKVDDMDGCRLGYATINY